MNKCCMVLKRVISLYSIAKTYQTLCSIVKTNVNYFMKLGFSYFTFVKINSESNYIDDSTFLLTIDSKFV